MRIDVWSDIVCPWCYLGHRRLTLALAELAADGIDDVEVHWHAFELDPAAPPEPGDLRRVIEQKYGPGAFETMAGRLGELGAEVGIEYRFDLAQRVNTFDAHRVVALAALDGPTTQDRVVDRLFRAYFSEGADVADRAALGALAAEAGLDATSVSAMLAGDSLEDVVRADEATAGDLGVGGVPAFVVDRQFLVSGAQDTATFVRLLRRVHAAGGTDR